MNLDRREAESTVESVRLALAKSATVPKRNKAGTAASIPAKGRAADPFESLPEYEVLRLGQALSSITGVASPFHRLHDAKAGEISFIAGQRVVNFASYDYVGLNGDPRVVEAVKATVEKFGMSASASRLAGGERQVHRDLDITLARLHGCEDALAFLSGHATNVSVIGTLLGPSDAIFCDALVHNSVLEGARLSGAKRILFPHSDLEALERALRLNRARHRRALIVVEGHYSMDGDSPDMRELIKFKRRYDAWLMVDEAHSVGVLGRTGRGIAEEQGINPSDVDIWMGTLSKSLSAAGGYIAGSSALIQILKYNTPAFVFSVGMPPPVAAAALAAADLMLREPERVARLRKNGAFFLAEAKARGLDTGVSSGAAIIPVIVKSSAYALILSDRLLKRGYNVVPAIFPGVAENQARLRFFVTSEHAPVHITGVLDAVVQELETIRQEPSYVSQVVGQPTGDYTALATAVVG
ncbi:8-amino-7-oxononanoate synthase [Enhydrobacter aerosaccus]|uniref:8-amino-7-oxononanoate synthase n=1 Tax=Enhydrobacter aerosaccus TaxID=225324 RepID=A0A1T4SC79_9HYPH|nr:aminotransferase class I/II-fold pyridoxal phosphate-dependent enzyme [Enhydrobacter aerosaccus]SKA25910.1 8-amino-7-oxononanoate synthase [Enhydrobacter aerosaccus]